MKPLFFVNETGGGNCGLFSNIPSQDDVKAMKTDVAHTIGQYLQENTKCASTKRGTILKGNAAIRKTGNLYRETGSVYFYLINVNLLSH